MNLIYEAPRRENTPGRTGLLQDWRLYGAVSAPFVVSETEKAGLCLSLDNADMLE